jgi:23S rRNA (adenine2503-C2)-methyltransferase
MTLLHPLRYTANEFAERMHTICGRGKLQAVALYQGYIREGKIRDDLPEFWNAPRLYEQMTQAIHQHIDPVVQVCSEDRATKFLMETHDGFFIESVIMTMHCRKSLCLSSQIGCRMACAFCKTGQMGIKRNLTPEEIVQQMFAAQHLLKTPEAFAKLATSICEVPAKERSKIYPSRHEQTAVPSFAKASPVQNIVFMGMGEPFDNFDAVMQAVNVLSDPLSFGIGLRRITISTSGDIPGIVRFANEERPLPNLAVSLGAPIDDIRSAIMPRRRKEPLCDLYEAMHSYCTRKKRHRSKNGKIG